MYTQYTFRKEKTTLANDITICHFFIRCIHNLAYNFFLNEYRQVTLQFLSWINRSMKQKKSLFYKQINIYPNTYPLSFGF